MSEINVYGTEESYGEVFQDWHLVRLVDKESEHPYIVSSGFEMKEGSWGLTWENDPDFVFDIDPMQDDQIIYPDEEIDEDSTYMFSPEYNEYMRMFNHYRDRLRHYAEVCHSLVESAIKSGWDEDEIAFPAYVSYKMWETLEKCNWKPIRISKSVSKEANLSKEE
jgi:hypothetical protein